MVDGVPVKRVNEKHRETERRNRELRLRFETERTAEVFYAYIATELETPIEDYANVARLVRENLDLCGSDLLFIAAFGIITWTAEENDMLAYMAAGLKDYSDYEKAVYYYLEALDAEKMHDYGPPRRAEAMKQKMADCLKKSIDYRPFPQSCFLYCRRVERDEEVLALGFSAIERTRCDEDLRTGTAALARTCQGYIDELILGIEMSDWTQEYYAEQFGYRGWKALETT